MAGIPTDIDLGPLKSKVTNVPINNIVNDNSDYTDANPHMSNNYEVEDLEWVAHPDLKSKNKDTGTIETQSFAHSARKAKPSLFNRYSLFFFDNTSSKSRTPEDYIDSPNRIDRTLQELRYNPTAKNIIEWSRSGKTNAVEYAAEDFLYCKKFNQVPNNYLVTLRRFSQPVNDDLFDNTQVHTPDVARMLTWVDGVDLKWENVGLKWSHGMTYVEQTSGAEAINAALSEGAGSEFNLFGTMGARVATAIETKAAIGHTKNESLNQIEPYADKNKIYGPIDTVITQMVRDKGLTFDQKFELRFEYELRSINNINPKVAFIDLLSNVLMMTSNKGRFWGGERRFYGGPLKKITPFGNAELLATGNYSGYMESLKDGFTNRMKSLTGDNEFKFPGSMEKLVSSVMANIGSMISGGLMDKMGRAQHQSINSLLTGDDTGEWHVTVGNPANPIISVGNLILENTTIEFDGVLGPDDFPTKLIVTCSLKAGRPRERLDMMSMFSRNNRTYLTTLPKSTKNTHKKRKKKSTGPAKLFSERDMLYSDTKTAIVDLSHRFVGFVHSNIDGASKLIRTAKNI